MALDGGADPRSLTGTVLAFAAASMWLLLLGRRRRTGLRPKLSIDVASGLGALGCVAWIGGLAFAKADPSAAVVVVPAAAALTLLAARLVLREPVPPLAWGFALVAAVPLALLGSLLLVLAGAGFGAQAVLMRRGSGMTRHASHLILSLPVAVVLLFDLPPLRGEALACAIAAGLCVGVGGWGWNWVRFPALAPLALVGAALTLGVAPLVPLVLAVIGAFGVQRMIGSNGS
ncbi:hypothetical protein [Falsirhodobacter sp. 20TX0035]|uniref:hypothetical protein n=1 Tax=Falsirhodobacter sp. 20TX0035 TaxID=3022019 RepID=UPI00232FD1C3|nr:hypothetical protein [Falsirhodobacter sp. 20TX0035]MDB6453796.1 hypothetical protein [Falsirhodobacter sp. 20TX0035]